MSKYLKIAGAAVSALVLTTAFSQAGSFNMEAAKKLNLSKVVGCTVSGTPSEFPDDIWIMNKGLGTIAAGTKVKWSVPAAGKQGVYTLGSSIAPGHGVAVSGVLSGGVEAGKPCSAKAL
jgi:hypothetical protein